MNTQYALWEKYLLYTILNRTITEKEQVEEVAAFFDCLPATFIRDGWLNGEKSWKTKKMDMKEGDEENVGKVVMEICEPSIRRSLISAFYHMDAAQRSVVTKFVINPLFCDAILSFCGFASTVLLHCKEPTHYSIETLLDAFNDRAPNFLCVKLDSRDVNCFLDICGSSLGLIKDAGISAAACGWTYFLAIWAVIKGRCSFWREI